MSDDFWGDVSLSNDTWSDGAADWGYNFDTPTYDVPSVDYGNLDWSSIFSNSDWMNDSFGTPSFDFTNDIDWASVLSNPDYFGPEYDALNDPTASIEDVLAAIEGTLNDPDLYSLLGGEGNDPLLGEGSNLLSISGDNSLGRLLTSAVNSDGLSTTDSANPMKTLLAALNKLVGGVNSASSSPLGQLAKKLAVIASRRQGIKNQEKLYNRAQQTAMANSQVGLRGNRTGLPNFNGAVKDPYSYVQPAPTIER